MPELTSDGKWKWGNIKKNSRKELSQTVYGIWLGTGKKGSFHNFYHFGDPYGKKHRDQKKKKQVKESCFLNPLLESADFFKRELFSKANVSIKELGSIINKLHIEKTNPRYSKSYRVLLDKKYWQFRSLRVRMRHKGINEVPLKLVERISGSN